LADVTVRIDGLREVRKALAATDRALPKELRREMAFEANVVVGHIRREIPSRSGRAAASVRAIGGSNRGGVTVDIKAGGARVPYFGWLEFGGKLPDKRPNGKKALASGGGIFAGGASSAFGPVAFAKGAERAKVSQGRYIRPTVKRHRQELLRGLEGAFNRAKQKAGL